MEVTEIKYFVEAALMAAARPLSIEQLRALFDESSAPEKSDIRDALSELQQDYKPRGIEVAEVASGFRMQVKATMAELLERLWEERPPRYSRALFETLALIAYRQPMTRGEIEEIRGVAVSSNIIRTLLERDWIRVVGHRDVPGRPSMFGSTRQFLDYFGLKKLDDLPPLADLSDWESLRVQLNLPAVEGDAQDTGEGIAAAELHEGAVIRQLPVAQRFADGVDGVGAAETDGEYASEGKTGSGDVRDNDPDSDQLLSGQRSDNDRDGKEVDEDADEADTGDADVRLPDESSDEISELQERTESVVSKG